MTAVGEIDDQRAPVEPGECGRVLGIVPCRLGELHSPPCDPAPEPPVSDGDPDWALRPSARDR